MAGREGWQRQYALARAGGADDAGEAATPQAALEARRRFERSEALEDVLQGRREVREFREAVYGPEGLAAIMDAEDRLNDSFDALCSGTEAPVWPTPRC